MTRFLISHQSIVLFLASVFMGAMFLSMAPAFAQNPNFTQPLPGGCDGYNPDDKYGLDCGSYSGLSPRDPRLIASRIINVMLSLLGILATSIIVFAGFKWMTAGGNSDQAQSARNILVAAVIGLIIIFSAASITNFIIFNLDSATR